MTGKQVAKLELFKTGRPDAAPFITTQEFGSSVIVTISGAPTEWPRIKIGAQGGIDLLDVRTYPNADAALMVADELLAKQNGRDLKKQASKPVLDALSQAAIEAEQPADSTSN